MFISLKCIKPIDHLSVLSHETFSLTFFMLSYSCFCSVLLVGLNVLIISSTEEKMKLHFQTKLSHSLRCTNYSQAYSRWASGNFQLLMQPKCWFPFWQEITIGSHPEPDEFSPHSHILYLEDSFNIISHFCLHLPSDLFS